MDRAVFPTREQLLIMLIVVAPLMLISSPVETLRAWRG